MTDIEIFFVSGYDAGDIERMTGISHSEVMRARYSLLRSHAGQRIDEIAASRHGTDIPPPWTERLRPVDIAWIVASIGETDMQIAARVRGMRTSVRQRWQRYYRISGARNRIHLIYMLAQCGLLKGKI